METFPCGNGAETIRTIWYSRCRKLFDDENIHLEAIKGIIKHRTQIAFSIYEANSTSRSSSLDIWKHAFVNSEVKNGRVRLNICLR
jgi:hypothetical protein